MAKIWVLNNVISFGSPGTPVLQDIFARLQWYETAQHLVRRVAHYRRITLKLQFSGLWRRVYWYTGFTWHLTQPVQLAVHRPSAERNNVTLVCNVGITSQVPTMQALCVWRNREALSCKHCCRPKAVSVTYSACVSVAFFYPACNAHAPYCHPWPAPLYSIFHIIS